MSSGARWIFAACVMMLTATIISGVKASEEIGLIEELSSQTVSICDSHGVAGIQFSLNNDGPWIDIDLSSPLYVPQGKRVYFQAVPMTEGGVLTEESLTWGGSSGASGSGEKISVIFHGIAQNAEDFRTVEAYHVGESKTPAATVRVLVYAVRTTGPPVAAINREVKLSADVLPDGISGTGSWSIPDSLELLGYEEKGYSIAVRGSESDIHKMKEFRFSYYPYGQSIELHMPRMLYLREDFKLEYQIDGETEWREIDGQIVIPKGANLHFRTVNQPQNPCWPGPWPEWLYDYGEETEKLLDSGEPIINHIFEHTGSHSIMARVCEDEAWAGLYVYDLNVEITDDENNVLTGDQTTIVGKRISLKGKVPTLNPPIIVDEHEWTIGGVTVKNYVHVLTIDQEDPEPENFGRVEVLNEDDLQRVDIEFYWIAGYDAQNKVAVTYEATVAGVKKSYTLYYEVKRPTAWLTATTSTLDHPIGIRENSLKFGTKDGLYGHVGIRWHAGIETPENGKGQIAFLQLVNTLRLKTQDDDIKKRKTSGGNFCLDGANSIHYGNMIVQIDNNDIGGLSLDDSPGTPLFGNKKVSVDENFELYFVYKPDGVDSIWVTLCKLEWFWKGSAIKENDIWGLDDDPESAYSSPEELESEDSTILPEWENRVQSLDWEVIND